MTLGSQAKSTTFDEVEYIRAPETDIADSFSNGNGENTCSKKKLKLNKKGKISDPNYKDAHSNTIELKNMKNGDKKSNQLGKLESSVPEKSGCCNRSEACVKKCALYSCFSGLGVLLISVIW